MSTSHTGYFRPADSQKAVGISRSTIYRWQAEGRIASRKVGGMTFFSIDDVKSIIGGLGDNLGDRKSAS